MFVIGIDPHRGSHTAAVLDGAEELLDEFRVVADRRQRQRLLEWAAPFMPRVWAVEGATGTGALLAQQLVDAGEHVLDVPPTVSARVRLLDSGRSDKTDSHDARSAAVVALRHRTLRSVRAEDHVAVLRLLAKRHHDLVAARTRTVCRLHTTLCHLAEGHFPKRMTASQGSAILARIRPHDPVSVERKALARDLLAEIRRADRDQTELLARIRTAVAGSGTAVTDVFGVGPVVAAYLIGPTGDIARFPTAGHYARYNGTAPIERTNQTAPAQPAREPPTQPRPPYGRGDPGPQRHAGPGLLPPQASRGTQPQRSHARPQAAHQRRRLPATPRRQPPMNGGPGRTTGTTPTASVTGSTP
jgi:transposase